MYQVDMYYFSAQLSVLLSLIHFSAQLSVGKLCGVVCMCASFEAIDGDLVFQQQK